MTSWRVCRQKDEEHRIRKEEKEAAKRLKKEKERQAREREARAMPGNPYGAYSNPMNDLERRMDGVDLGRGRNASQGEYNSKRWAPISRGSCFLSLWPTVRVAVSAPDRAAIAQHGRHEPWVSAAGPGGVSEHHLSAIWAWPRHIPRSLSVPRRTWGPPRASHPVALQGPFAQSYG